MSNFERGLHCLLRIFEAKLNVRMESRLVSVKDNFVRNMREIVRIGVNIELHNDERTNCKKIYT